MTWEFYTTYRGIDIEVFMPGSIAYRAYFDGDWHTREPPVSNIQGEIDAFLDAQPPEPPVDGNGAAALGGLGLLILLYLIFTGGN